MAPSPDLRELVERAQSGDVSAISELYHRYASSLFRYLLARISELELAQDLTQEVFIRVIKGITKFEYRDEKSFLGWLYAIAGNVLNSHLRRRRLVATPLDDQNETSTDDSRNETRRAFERVALQQAMNELTEDQQQVLALRFFADLSNSEVAGILQRSEGAIKAIQYRALQSLQKILSRDVEDPARRQVAPEPATAGLIGRSAELTSIGAGPLKTRSGD